MLDPEIAFGNLTLRPNRQLMANGRSVALGGKALEILSVLAGAKGALVTKDELMARVWDGVIVDENAIQVHVTTVRKALGSEASRLVTIRGRGYLLETEPLVTKSPAAGLNRRSTAVLAFVNLTGDPSMEYLGDGVAEELICALSRANELKVAARTSSFAYKDRGMDVRSIARELGVATIIEGSVRTDRDLVRVSVQLIDAQTGFPLWSESYDRQKHNLLTLHDELARAISLALHARMPKSGKSDANAEAVQLYMQARSLETRPTPQNVVAAVDLYRRAIDNDAHFARAWAGLASSLMIGIDPDKFSCTLPPGHRAEAKQAAERALALNSELAEAHAVLGSLHAFSGCWFEAAASHKQALALGADEPMTHLNHAFSLLVPLGYSRRATDESGQAYALAPAWVQTSILQATIAWTRGDNVAAARYARTAVTLGFPEDRPPVSSYRIITALEQGNYEEAARLQVECLPPPLRAARGAEVVSRVFAAFRGSGSASVASQSIDEMLDAPGTIDFSAQYPATVCTPLIWQALLGMMDEAYALADRMITDWQRTGYLDIASLGTIWLPRLRSFRQDARFQSLTSRLGMVAYWNECGPPDGCSMLDGKLVCH